MPRRLTTQEFIARARARFGAEYDYTRVRYVNSRTKIQIVCRRHGAFELTPILHLHNGLGCPKCATRDTKRSLEEFLIRARAVHGRVYDYRHVESINQKVPIKIICPQHGRFELLPNSHIGGKGCRQCGIERRQHPMRVAFGRR